MADRKAELEKKRKKLEELKKAREQNKLQTKDKEVTSLLAPVLVLYLDSWLVYM